MVNQPLKLAIINTSWQAISNGSLNTEWKTLKQGSPIKTYGPKHYINNEAYYRVGKNAYVKAENSK